jgi:hypothetical protein
MGFQVSPGVEIKEFDLTAIVPAVSTTPSGFVGAFEWGPSEQRVLINSEKTLRETFGNPSKKTFYSTSWFVAQNFLTYGSNLLVGRVVLDSDTNAIDSLSQQLLETGDSVLIKNRANFEETYKNISPTDFIFAAKYPGTLANGLTVLVYDVGSLTEVESTNTSFTELQLQGFINKDAPNTSSYASAINSNAEDEVHIVVVDSTGKFTGNKDTVVESFLGLSKAPSAKNPDGTTNYWRNVINNRSLYLWAGAAETDTEVESEEGILTDDTIAWDYEVSLTLPYRRIGLKEYTLTGGTLTEVTSVNRTDVESNVAAAFDLLFGDSEEVDVSLLIAGDLQSDGGTWAKRIIEIAEARKDCVAFVSPPTEAVIQASATERADVVLNYRNGGVDGYIGLGSSSYGVMDSGPKYQYDRYNDRFIYVPLCGDIAGCCVRTDTTREPWYSPAGYDRGRINNIVKLVYNPNKEQRDLLYQKGVNPVVTFQGSGAILFGDKTLQTKASAFDRINVRRLFIVLEKAIATAAKFQLFEFNDAFTRNQFRQLVEPFLRDVQGRRGISSYAVVCDESNNPPSIVDSNQFVADIFIAPARSINFIKLNFVATPTGVQFAEFGG